MNEAEISAVVIGITEIVKNLGLPSKICPLFAVCAAIGFTILTEVQNGGTDYTGAALKGLLIGTTTTGGYSAIDRFITKSSLNGNLAQETH